jgi:hypothetical protein
MRRTFVRPNVTAEILGECQLKVRRPNREDLLQIRKGVYTYEALMARAEQILAEIEALAETSALPDQPKGLMERLLVDVRKGWYGAPA